MTRWIFALLASLSLGSAGLGQSPPLAPAQRFHSAVLGEGREYRVSLPASYGWAKERRYPVLYVLDGESNFVHTAASVAFLAAAGEIPEMIVVGITSTVRVRDFSQTDWPSVWVGGGGAANFKRFLATELLPRVEGEYRTDGFRVLSGHSAGGQFVLHCLASEPSLFRAYVALSPSLDWDDNLPQRELAASFAATPSLPAFLYVARSDDFGRPLADYEKLVETLRTKSPRGFRWHSQAFPQETHSSVTLLGTIDAVRHVYEGYRLHSDEVDKGLAFAERHFEQVSERVGWPLPVPEEVINGLAYAALSEERTQEAIDLFERNVRANPSSANAWDGLADGYAQAGAWTKAAEAASRAVTLATELGHPQLPYFTEQSRKMQERLARESADPR